MCKLVEWNECPQCGSESVGGNCSEINHCNNCRKTLWNTPNLCYWCKSTDINHTQAVPMSCNDCDWSGDPYESLWEEWVEKISEEDDAE